jgi:hypothetical protein
MRFVIIGNIAVVIEKAIFDHKQSTVGKDACFAALFDYFR